MTSNRKNRVLQEFQENEKYNCLLNKKILHRPFASFMATSWFSMTNEKKVGFAKVPIYNPCHECGIKQLVVVPTARLELARSYDHYPLKIACLPIPPCRQ